MPQPLPLPDEYDAQAHMLAHSVGERVFHATIQSAMLAAQLMQNGTPPDIAIAAQIFRAVLGAQETRAGDPHRGNFRWELEDEVVEDLNAVQFVLFYFVPALIENTERLPADLVADMRRAIQLGLEEIARIDVGVAYTNIVIKDIANSCLGGELLGDEKTAKRGREKLVRWMQHVDTYGLPAEYNSPNYAAVAVRVLGCLAALVKHNNTRIRARTILARLGLSAALHIHPGTGAWAGPFSRAYRHAVFNGDFFNAASVRTWVNEAQLPAWIGELIDRPATEHQVDETAHGEEPVALSTYHSPSFCLGVSTCELKTQEVIFIALQSNAFYAQYQRGPNQSSGVLFSRYLLDDEWNSFQTTPSRESGQVLPEQGHFYGVQDRGRAIALYAPRGLDAWTRHRSAKAVLIWTELEHIDEIWIGTQKIEGLPAAVPDGAVVVVGSGALWTGVRPLTRTDLGGGAGARLVEIDGHLALEMYNYQGPAKTFWELAHPGSFYQGQPRCGFYSELVERSAYASGDAFAEHIAQGTLREKADPAATYEHGQERRFSVEYTRDDRTLGIEVDLYAWKLKRRWNQGGGMGWPMHESPYARQTAAGTISVGGATLSSERGPTWLCAPPGGKRFIAAYSGHERTTLRLEVPGDVVEIDNMGTGIIVWDDGELIKEYIE
ncbi:MAG: hypothetical protein ACI8PG_003728 [Planctomycetota bacterium]|jgi:hypothetical protein